MDAAEIKQQITVFERARNNLLAVIAFSTVNLFLSAFGADLYFLFSATMPQFIFEIGKNLDIEMGTDIFMIVGFIVAVVTIIPYFVFWILAKRIRTLMLAALIFFGIDTLVLLFLIFGIGFEVSYLFEIAFHGWVLFYLINGVQAWSQTRSVGKNDFDAIIQEIKQKNPEPAKSNESDNSNSE